MSLNFPNGSRSYDAARQRIRFLGHDGMAQVPFFVEVTAITKAGPVLASAEADYLAAFDAARGSILDVARKAYAHDRRDAYVLTTSDFR